MSLGKIEKDRIKGHHKGMTAGRILLGTAILDRDLPGKASVNKVVNYMRSARTLRRDQITATSLEKNHGESVEVKPAKTLKQSRDPLSNTSEKSIFNMWSAFKSVAHVYAADELLTLLWTAHDLMCEGKDLHSKMGWGDEIHRWVDSSPLEFGDYIHRWLDSYPVDDDDDELKSLQFLAETEHLRSYGEAKFSSGMISQDRSTLDPKSTWKVPTDISLPDPILALDLPPWLDLINFCRSEYQS